VLAQLFGLHEERVLVPQSLLSALARGARLIYPPNGMAVEFTKLVDRYVAPDYMNESSK
jgi:hypothetical protein